MTAPVYSAWLYTPDPIKVGVLRWAWHVGDGYLRTLAEGTTPTRWGARRARDRFAGTCRSASEVAAAAERELRTVLAEVVEQLHADGIDVEAELDERGRPCVQACCKFTDVEHRTAMQAFCRRVGPVRWAGVA